MKQRRKWLLMLVCALMLSGASVAYASDSADTAAEEETQEAVVKDGWDAEKTHYYKDGKALTGLQTIAKKKYFFGKDGTVLKKAFKKVKDGKKKYTFYFGKDGAAYKAAKDEYEITCKIKTVKGKKYGFDEKSHMVTGIWVASDGKLYAFKKSGAVDSSKTKKLRKLVKRGKKSKSLWKNIKKKSAFGKAKKIKSASSCNYFDSKTPNAKYTDYIVNYAHIQIQMTKNKSTGVFQMLGAFPKSR